MQESCKLTPTSTTRRFSSFLVKSPAASQIEDFLTDVRVTLSAGGAQGTTWLELYVMFRAAGFSKPIPDYKDKARSSATVAQQLRAFKNTTRAVVERIFVGSSAKALFKPATSTCEPLSAFHI